jgi:mannitol-1-phosphate 5-dehydrogenase
MIWQAVRDPKIAAVARAALSESAEALNKKHGVSLPELQAFSEDLMARFDNPLLGDTVARVGRDPVRKLAPEDRLVGAANTCVEQGVTPRQICRGIAAGLLFTAPSRSRKLKRPRMEESSRPMLRPSIPPRWRWAT